jgi:NAD(P)H-hydrate epimerase
MGKIGLFCDPGIRMAGAVDVVDIGFPRMSMETVRPSAWRLDAAMVAKWLPARPLDSNKGTFGSALIVAGSAGMLGAATLCARAALRAGAGLVRLAVPASLLSLANTLTPEVICCPVPDGGTGLFAPEALESILELAGSSRAAAIGPGLTASVEAGKLLKELLPRLRAPVVLDADGLNLLAGGMASLENRPAPTILTPHPGEMGRLAGMDVKSVQACRLAVAGDLARKLEAVVVLKGLATVTASPAGDLLLNSTGNPGMASAGMGDALTGALVGLLAQGMDPFQAAGCAVYLHGLAGDLSAVSRGDAGLLSSDIVDALPRARRITKDVGTAEANTN